HLRIASDYSLLRSALKIKNIIEIAKKHKMPAIGLADYNSLSGVFEFSEAAINSNIQPIIGYECLFLYDDIQINLLLYAQNQSGLQNLFKLTGYKKLTLKIICENNKGIIVLARDILLNNALKKSGAIKDIIKLLVNNFPDRLYIELQRVENYIDDERHLLLLAEEYDLPIVATHPVFFASANKVDSCDILRCISSGNYFSDPSRQTISKECYFKSEGEMKELFSNLPDALENSVLIAKRCGAIVEESPIALPDYPTEDINKTLRDESYSGLKKQLECNDIPQEYIERLEYELSVIIKMNYSGYMLIVSDFIKWAKENDVPVGPGRGSGVGSLVAWSLLITDLDPLKFGLIFERFLNPERISMPDFDIDFCQERRHLVIDYVLKKYGYVAHIITFGTLQARAVLRDVGRVLQIPYPVVDRICKKIPNNPAKPVTLAEALNLDPELNDECRSEEVLDRLLTISLELEGLYRHASVHAAGIIISSRPFYEFLPVTYSDDTDLPVSQYAMKYTEKAGLVKFDFLGLKTLTIIKNTIKLLDNPFDISKIPLDDKKTYELLSAGKSIAVFQIESMFMQNTLRSLQPDNIEDIIALISLNRPGPLENIPVYIERKHGRQKVDYIHELLQEVLKETYGVIIYQEQVMKIAQILSGYSLAEADILRRAMGKKIQSEMDKQCKIFIDGAKNNNV
ncbi:MAG: DNA polymerase III subunit alpha, partial [Candidatus Heimdallarchaeota archaeon]|nr:DNA polymerase III subunit alpha [Candidatus Heimdallarchaeota archaeon]